MSAEPPPGWTRLAPAGLDVRALRVARRDVSFLKFLFESYEGVAILRTVETVDRATAIVAVLAPPDMSAEAEAIIASVVARGAPPIADAPLPAACHEDWFLEEWARADAAVEPDPGDGGPDGRPEVRA